MASQKSDNPRLAAATNELIQSLNALTKQITKASKEYSDLTGQHGLLQRQKMANVARQIINAVREPGETPYEFSTHVSLHPYAPPVMLGVHKSLATDVAVIECVKA